MSDEMWEDILYEPDDDEDRSPVPPDVRLELGFHPEELFEEGAAPPPPAGGQTLVENRLIANQAAAPAPAPEGSFDLAPDEAMAWWKEKRVVLPDEAEGLSPAMRQRAFWIDGMTDVEKVGQVGALFVPVMREGWTPAGFREELRSLGILSAPGEEPKDGQIPPAHADTVFRQNLYSAYGAGRYVKLRRTTETRPYWQYRTAGDEYVRLAHAALDGIVKAWDDPFWASFYPPWEFYCRCTVYSVSYDELGDLCLTVADDAEEAARYRAAQQAAFPGEFQELWQGSAPLLRQRQQGGGRLQLIPSNPAWTFNRGDAYFLAAEGQAPATDAGAQAYEALLERGRSMGEFLEATTDNVRTKWLNS